MLVFGFVVVPAVVLLTVADSERNDVLLFIAMPAGFLIATEVMFRFGHRVYFGAPYHTLPRLQFEQFYVEPHPYILFIYKRRFPSQKGGVANYP